MKVYLDNAATTAVNAEVLAEMIPYFGKTFGNPSSLHGFGREALKAVDEARETVAKCIGAKPNEIYFTSGGTESDNWAIKGIAEAYKKLGKHIVTSVIEHPAVLETCQRLEKHGYEVTYLPVDQNGQIRLDDLKSAVREDTILVSVMTANNEIGAIQPVAEIGEFCRSKGVFFHTDAVQAMGVVPFDMGKMKIDMLSMSAHKFHGPKGIGVLYLRSGVKPSRLIDGGHQERRQRAGTTDTPLVVGLAKALKMATDAREENCKRVSELRDYFIERVLNEIPDSHLNGGRENRLPGNANFSFDYIEGESILFNLDMEGIAVSSGSACSSGSLEPSHVILAIGVKEELAHSSTRFSLGVDTTKEELDYTVEKLKATVAKLRSWSPLFNERKEEGKYV